jgi:hypothetical protein
MDSLQDKLKLLHSFIDGAFYAAHSDVMSEVLFQAKKQIAEILEDMANYQE